MRVVLVQIIINLIMEQVDFDANATLYKTITGVCPLIKPRTTVMANYYHPHTMQDLQI